MARKTPIKLPGFGGVDESGGSFHIQSGDYLMKCLSVEEGISKQDNEMLVFKFEGLEKAAKNRQFRLHCTLTDNSLWKLKQTLRALGLEVPDDPSDLDPSEVEDIEVIGTVTDNEYEGKVNSRLSEIRAVSDVEDEPATATTTKRAKTTTATTSKAASTKTATTKNGKPKLSASEVEDMAEEELFEINETYDLGIDLDDHKTTLRKRNAIIAGLQANKMLEA
jgi:hypothetical protein